MSQDATSGILAVGVSPVGVGDLDGLRRRARVLRLLYGTLPVRVGVLVEDHVAVLLARRVALPHDVPQRSRRLEEPQLRLEVLLAVHLGVYRPEGVGAVHEHLGRQGVYAVLPDLELPIAGGPEREVTSEVPGFGVPSEYPGRHAHHRDALVVPG